MKVDVQYDPWSEAIVVSVRLENGHHHTEFVSFNNLMQMANTTYYPTDVGDAGIEKAAAEPKTDADKAVDDAIERAGQRPAEKPLSWEERLKKELNEGVDTWGRIAKKHQQPK